jgi:hypothetical protein
MSWGWRYALKPKVASVPAAMRRQIIELAQGRCEYCRLPETHSPAPFAIDHILPRSLEGDDELENLALSCPGCNGAKYNKVEAADPATGATALLFHPRRQSWNDHFAWSENSLTVVGLTATGRATVEVLRLNREGAQNLRDLLQLRGIHPPSDEE